ncbi:MAG: Rieske 2Fe-2S domain-containing protein [Acidimicrobiia bacterium]|nr:Rieske 2Fe-2S domain-containing protein [Acidimicrobiia bacterium]
MGESAFFELTGVGPGTLMGEFMRQYWIPAGLSAELRADGDPMRLPLLGEKLIAFRDSSGRAAVMDQRCPHRCASLFLGRNEDDGIRCVYHGWKFSADGTCVDMPNVPNQAEFRDKIRAKAYPVVERAGLLWVYMGPRQTPPPLPQLEVTMLDESELVLEPVLRDCNWLQALEGDIDTSHFGFLHVGHVQPDDLSPASPLYNTVTNRAPAYHTTTTDWGTSYGAHRPADDDTTYWRFANFIFPFWTQQPQGRFERHVHARAWVPLDDHHTLFINVAWKGMARAVSTETVDGRPIEGMKLRHAYAERTTDWFGRWRLAHGEADDWGIDRAAQRENRIYTGIDDIHLQDQAVTESMGPVTDFDFEHLTVSDQMIATTRRRLLGAARALRDEGTVPPGVDDPELFREARSGFFTAPNDVDWRDAYAASAATMERPGAITG